MPSSAPSVPAPSDPARNAPAGEPTASLRVAVLIDVGPVPWHVHAFAAWAAARPGIELAYRFVRREPGGPSAPPLSTRSLRALRAVEARTVGEPVRSVGPLVRDAGGSVAPSGGVLDEPHDDAGAPALGFDLLVSFGPRAPAGALRRAAALGALRVVHEGESDASGDTAGLQAVLARRPVTTWAVLRDPPDDSAPRVVARGNVRNRFSFVRNQTAARLKSLARLRRLVELAAATRSLPVGGEPTADDPAGLPAPGLATQGRYALRFALAAVGRIRAERFPGMVPQWSVHYVDAPWTALRGRPARAIPNPPGAFLADPFVLEEDGRTWCFVEEYPFAEARGCIAAYELAASGPSRVGRVLVEPFHLSFPYLFRYDGRLFMLPETSGARDVRVYECTRVPDRWALRAVLMSDVDAADTMVFEHGGRWWMLTNLDPARTDDFCSELHLFHADSPLSDRWTPHPLNPVIDDALRARNGGLLFDGGVPYRVAQRQAFDTYGSGFAVRRIDVLTPEAYVEVDVGPDGPGPSGWPARVHHVHGAAGTTVFDRCRIDRGRG